MTSLGHQSLVARCRPATRAARARAHARAARPRATRDAAPRRQPRAPRRRRLAVPQAGLSPTFVEARRAARRGRPAGGRGRRRRRAAARPRSTERYATPGVRLVELAGAEPAFEAAVLTKPDHEAWRSSGSCTRSRTWRSAGRSRRCGCRSPRERPAAPAAGLRRDGGDRPGSHRHRRIHSRGAAAAARSRPGDAVGPRAHGGPRRVASRFRLRRAQPRRRPADHRRRAAHSGGADDVRRPGRRPGGQPAHGRPGRRPAALRAVARPSALAPARLRPLRAPARGQRRDRDPTARAASASATATPCRTRVVPAKPAERVDRAAAGSTVGPAQHPRGHLARVRRQLHGESRGPVLPIDHLAPRATCSCTASTATAAPRVDYANNASSLLLSLRLRGGEPHMRALAVCPTPSTAPGGLHARAEHEHGTGRGGMVLQDLTEERRHNVRRRRSADVDEVYVNEREDSVRTAMARTVVTKSSARERRGRRPGAPAASPSLGEPLRRHARGDQRARRNWHHRQQGQLAAAGRRLGNDVSQCERRRRRLIEADEECADSGATRTPRTQRRRDCAPARRSPDGQRA